jgi:hypothetical protein
MPVISGGVIHDPGTLVCEERTFTQAANNTGGTYTATVTVPANSWIVDIKVYAVALWNSATSASLDVGDASVADGFYSSIDLLATDLLADEVLAFDSAGGSPGAYIVAATGLRNTMWSASERVITGLVTEATTTVVATGITRMLVIYSTTSNAGAAVFAA